MLLHITVVILACLCVILSESSEAAAAAANPSLVATMEFLNPAFLSFVNMKDQTSSTKTQLLATTFGMTQNFISVLNGIDTLYNTTTKNNKVPNNSKIIGNTDYVWPNVAEQIPSEVFSSVERASFCSGAAAAAADSDSCELLVIPDGFLVPGHKTGGVHIQGVNLAALSGDVNVEPIKSFNVAGEETNWFYHKANWFDMDKDGLMDMIIARCNVNTFGQAKGELVWLKHPSDPSQVTKPWKMSVLANGPDIISMPLVGNDGLLYIISAEFFAEKLSVTSVTPGATPKVNSYTIVDSSPGPSDDLKLADVDGDGVVELILTTHQNKDGKVYAYELPANLLPAKSSSVREGGADWQRVLIATGFVTTLKGQNQASPGFIYPMPYLDKSRNMISNRPYFAIAGDGSESFHLLTPIADPNNAYAYKLETIFVTNGTVGTVAVGDLNSDGIMEVCIPDYDNGFLYFYSFKDYIPSSA